MNHALLIKKLNELRSLPSETEVVEFKTAGNDYSFAKIGKYFSALCNEANLMGKSEAWLIFGIEDKKKNVVGTNYRNTNRESLDSLKSEVAGKTTNRITFIEIYELNLPEGRVVMFQIPPAPRGIPIAWEGHYYGRDDEELGPLNIEEFERIRKQASLVDWSAVVCPDATIEDLDPTAIEKARLNYSNKFPDQKKHLEQWDDITFLNKAKITIKGKITRAAIILLGKPESEHFINPAESKIRWVLKDRDGIEKDYTIFTCPLLLAVDEVFNKIRNLKYRYIKTDSLFPEEVDQYEPYVIREAINNCIAHQDYSSNGGRINVIEKDDELVFSNVGTFIPVSVENVIKTDAPEEIYRNPFLATAMVNLKMVDTIGSGIKRMFTYQRNRFFPLPQYDFSNAKVKVTITGKVLDLNYAKLLANNPELNLKEIVMLDKVQKKLKLSDEEYKYLKSKNLLEGNKRNYFITASIAQKTGQKAAYTKNKAFTQNQYFDWVVQGIKDHGSLTRSDIDGLIWTRLSDLYDTDSKKKAKINYILSTMRTKGIIKNVGNDHNPKWVLIE